MHAWSCRLWSGSTNSTRGHSDGRILERWMVRSGTNGRATPSSEVRICWTAGTEGEVVVGMSEGVEDLAAHFDAEDLSGAAC